MAKTSAERVRAYRRRQRESGGSDSSQQDKRRQEQFRRYADQKAFCGCDGEGCGTDDLGRQLYQLFRMGERELFTGFPLTTLELLDFICDDPGETILVGFSFGYDVTMILRDLPEGQQRRLFEPKETGEGKSRYTWFKQFDIEYLSKQYFRVRRTTINQSGKRVPVKGSTRTIWETFGFFQKSFVKAVEQFEVGTKGQRKTVAENKARRSTFDRITDEERRYCELECQMLAELMENLRDYCHAAGIRPRTWNGAGKLAAALHKREKTITRKDVTILIPQDLLDFSNVAYYGGRFEITRTGMITEPVYEYDIRSAYPDAMRYLPCLIHGRWHKATGDELWNSSLFIASIKFNHPDLEHGQLCGFPVRTKEGHLYWPLEGRGVYWSPEIRAAQKLGAQVSLLKGWRYEENCDCFPFQWVKSLYDYRRSIGSSGPGYPIKLGINALYGMLAQRVGRGNYANLLYAGLITALTRAKLSNACSLAPGRIVMLATDALYSLDPLPLNCGDELGQWEHEALNGLFIVQPGLYWCPEKRKRKSRGLPGKFFEEPGRTESFEQAWQNYRLGAVTDIPACDVPLVNFIGLKLALSWGKPERAGVWDNTIRSISFDYSNKREGHIWDGDNIVTRCKPGNSALVSLPHRDFLKAGGQEAWEFARSMLDDQPDYVDLGPPFKD